MKNFFFFNLRFRENGDRVLVSTDDGSYCFLQKKELTMLFTKKARKSLVEMAEKNGIITTKENYELVAKRYLNKRVFVEKGPTLHTIRLYGRRNKKETNEHIFTRIAKFIMQSSSKDIRVCLEVKNASDLSYAKKAIEEVERANKKNKEAKTVRYSLVAPAKILHSDLRFDEDKTIEDVKHECHKSERGKKIEAYKEETKKREQGRILKRIFTKYKIRLKVLLEGGQSINKIKEVINEIKQIGRNSEGISFVYPVTKNSLLHYKEICDVFSASGADSVRFEKISLPAKHKPKDECTTEEYLHFWRSAVEYMNRRNKNSLHGTVHGRMLSFGEEHFQDIIGQIEGKDVPYCLSSPCGGGIRQLGYDLKGGVYSCAKSTGIEVFKIGDVSQNLRKIVQSEEMSAFIASSLNELHFCAKCVYKPFCGLCPVSAYALHGTLIPLLPKDERCRILKEQFEFAFNILAKK
ncbi:MAG: SPASM domain-containing protein [Candidatus Woesearchaeota archaeon]